MPTGQRGVSRRAFVRSAVAIGGASALAACTEREGVDVPRGPRDLDSLPDRQHAWNDVLRTDEHGNVLPPEHHVLLLLEYAGNGPTEEERERVEATFQTLERAYRRGSDGLVFTVGYAPTYFEQFDEALPASVDLPHPESLASFEDPEFDDADALVHLASDNGSAVLATESALRGEREELNGVTVEDTLEGIFAVPTDSPGRRTGFVGEGLPAERQDGLRGVPGSDPVPEEAPLFMGFKSGFERNQASEDRVTITDGPFAGGTTTHLSRIRLDLRQWYEQGDRNRRVSEMFCPAHAADGRVEGAGHDLGDSSQLDECIETLEDDARAGIVGHAQKSAQVREDDEPIILRRDFNSTDDGEAGVHFLAHQRAIGDFVATREAMNATDLARDTAIGSQNNNGILQYMRVLRRANFLVPPRSYRALPSPNPES